uniref:Flavin-containing monooxygenase n=3 Tax=Zea mays TaxID=4577 RepID=A0A804LNB7_MAIZE
MDWWLARQSYDALEQARRPSVALPSAPSRHATNPRPESKLLPAPNSDAAHGGRGRRGRCRAGGRAPAAPRGPRRRGLREVGARGGHLGVRPSRRRRPAEPRPGLPQRCARKPLRVAAHKPDARPHGLLGLPDGRLGVRGRRARVPGPPGGARVPRRLRGRVRRRRPRQAPLRGAARGGGAPRPAGAPLGQRERWAVSWRREDGEVAEEVFDAVVVCNGHCTVPRVPGIRGIDNWSGKQIHSHNYRTPEPFRDQNVVVVGFSTSGIDIASEISRLAKEVHVADRYSRDRLGKMALYQNVWIHAEVDCIQDDGKVRFAEGSVVDADVILYCTGYRYHFPFLDLDGLTVDDNRVGPLYKHVFPPKYAPNLSFVGLPVKTIVFQELEQEAKWVAAVLSGRATLPSEEDMMASVRSHYQLMEEAGRPKRHTHALAAQWAEHMNWLADQVGEPPVEPWKCEVFDKVLASILALDEAYRDRWEQEEDGGSSGHQEGIRIRASSIM